MATTARLSWLTSSRNWPFIGKRNFLLTLDSPSATDNEIFWGIQVIYTAEQTSPPLVLVQSGDDTGTVNPIYAGLNGGVYAVAGRGIVSSGVDVHGTAYTVTPISSSMYSKFKNAIFSTFKKKEGKILKNIRGEKVIAIDPGYIVIGLGGDQSQGGGSVVYSN